MDIFKGFHEHFGWFIYGLAALGVLWFFNGGPARETAHEGQYLKPLAPLDTGQAYGKYYAGAPINKKETLDLPEAPANIVRETENFLSLSKQAEQIHMNSLLAKKISFDGVAGAKQSNPNKEYIRILSSEYAEKPTTISGLVLQGTALGSAVVVPRAANLPYGLPSDAKSDVVLPPGGRALITSGASPLGESFRVNMCTGYFGAQGSTGSSDYTPGLRNDCPEPLDELEAAGLKDDDACSAFVEKIPRCTAYKGSVPSSLSSACRSFITERLTYRGCVANHKNDKDFYFDEWRLFLNQSGELWQNSDEIIKLIDAKGNVVDAITY